MLLGFSPPAVSAWVRLATTCLVLLALIVCATTSTTTTTTNTTGSPQAPGATTRPKAQGASNQTSVKPTLIASARPAKASSSKSSIKPTMGQQTPNKTADHQGAASLLRPSFIRSLLGGPHKHRQATEQSSSSEAQQQQQQQPQGEEEEEEVTQTIVVPINPDDPNGQQLHQTGMVIAGKSRPLRAESMALQHQQHLLRGNSHMSKLMSGDLNQLSVAASQAQTGSGGLGNVQPNAEASLRLTSTEIGGLLNDREAPEFYRERELNGDGVMVGEEPTTPGSAGGRAASSLSSTSSSHMGMAASGPFGSQFMGDSFGGAGGRMGGGFEGTGDAAALYRHRLAQAASEEGYGGGGFNHRFGSQSFGGDELGGGRGGQYGGGGGGLMQSPNEYSEVNNYAGGGGFMGEQAFAGGGGDFSPHSGLLKAGSGDGGVPFGGGIGGMMGGGGSGGLDMAAAYGGGSEYSGAGGDFGAGQNAFLNGAEAGRLQAHASFNPYMQSAAGEAEYASRFGQHQAGMGGSPFGLADQRGFASQNNHQFQRLQGAASGGGGGGGSGQGNRLMPLTPVVPLMDDLSGSTQPSVLSSNQREVTHGNLNSGAHHLRGAPGAGGASQQQQVHEAIEDDPTDVSTEESPSTMSEHHQRQQVLQQHYEGTGSSGEETQDGMVTTTMGSVQAPHEGQFGRSQTGGGGGGGGGHSLVLNVPPPPDEQRASAQMVEFSRIGSAGYLGPGASFGQGRMLAKKSGQHQSMMVQSEGGGDDDQSGSVDESSEVDSPSGGADNPAHAGKYIID